MIADLCYRSSVAFTPFRTPAEWLDSARVESSVDLNALRAVAVYVAKFLTDGHPQLGRTGPVCPFAAGGLKAGMVQLAACSLDQIDEAKLTSAVDEFRGMFRPLSSSSQENKAEIYRSVVIVFSRLPADGGPALIERVQKRLKAVFVGQGLMIGEFYPDCPAPGIHNTGFRPLRAPITSIAIRRITLFDAPFMLDDPQCLQSYQDRFGDPGRTRVEKLLNARLVG